MPIRLAATWSRSRSPSSYFNRHLWWRPDHGGARIVDEGQKTDGGRSYDVLSVTPVGGTPVDAWFDPATYLLFRTVGPKDTQTLTTTYSNYAPVDGAMIAKKLVLDDGSGDLQTYAMTSARFSKALPLQAYRKPAEHLHDFSIAGGAHETTIPFRITSDNHIYADVSINGSKPMTFEFDTGAQYALTTETANKLGITPVGSSTDDGGGDKRVQSGYARLKSVTIGGATATNQPVLIEDFRAPGVSGLKIAGLIGYEFFARFVTRFDYAHHTVTFIDKKHFDPASAGTPVPMRLFHSLIEVLGSYDGIPGRFAIDTGARDGLLLNTVWAAEHGIPRPGVRTLDTQTGWGVGGPMRGAVFRDGALKLGDVAIAHPLAILSTNKGGALAVRSFPNDVGGGILKRFIVTVDYGHDTLYLKRIPGPVSDIDTFDRSGMWINTAPGGFKVISITKGGAAEAAGLKEGDLITAIDGKAVTQSELNDVRRDWRNQPPGTAVALTVERGSESRTATLILENMI